MHFTLRPYTEPRLWLICFPSFSSIFSTVRGTVERHVLQRTISKVGPWHWAVAKHETSESALLSSTNHTPEKTISAIHGKSRRAAIARTKSRATPVFSQHFLRSYVARTEFDLSTYPSPLWQRLSLLGKEEHSDDTLRELWRDILESFGNGEYGLPVEGEDADRIWTTFISLGSRDHVVMEELYGYADRLWDRERRERQTFYSEVIAALIRTHEVSKALWFHKELSRKVDIGSDDLLAVLYNGCPSAKELEHFQRLCESVPKYRLHDEVIGCLCKNSRIADALMMHEYFMRRRDYPRDVNLLHQLHLQAATEGHEVLARFRQGLTKAKINIFDTEVVTGFEEQEHGLSDNFVAKIIATRAFSLDFILRWVSMFASQKLGPLALRELCVRATTLSSLEEALRTVGESGLLVGRSTFFHVVDMAVKDKDEALFISAIESDQHPDVMEDVELQKSLFIEQYWLEDHRALHLTRMILRAHSYDDAQLFNLVLCGMAEAAEWNKAVKTLLTMTRLKIQLSQNTLKILSRTGFQPDSGPQTTAEVKFIISLAEILRQSPQTVSMDCWNGILTLLGHGARFDELGRLMEWLATTYTSPRLRRNLSVASLSSQVPKRADGRKKSSVQKSYLLPADDLHQVFCLSFQRRLVKWGFYHGSQRLRFLHGPNYDLETTGTDMLLYGVHMLKKLSTEYQVVVPERLLRDSIAYRLHVMIGEGITGREHKLYSVDAVTRASILTLAKEANSIWDKRLLPESEIDLFNELSHMNRHSRAKRDRARPNLSMFKSEEKNIYSGSSVGLSASSVA